MSYVRRKFGEHFNNECVRRTVRQGESDDLGVFFLAWGWEVDFDACK